MYDCSIWFLIISGFLFRHLIGRKSYLDFVMGKVKRVLLPYVVLSIPAMLWIVSTGYMHSIPEELARLPVVQRVMSLYVTGMHLGPYWFMPMMFVFFVLAPLFIYMDKKPWAYICIIPLGVVTYMTDRNFIQTQFNDQLLMRPVGNCLHYASVFIFGMMISKYEDRFKVFMEYAHPVLMSLCVVLLYFMVVPKSFCYQLNSLFKMMVAVFVLYALSAQTVPNCCKNGLSFLGSISFGMYFVHGYLIGTGRYFWRKYISYTLPSGDIAMYLMSVAVVVALSAAVILGMKKVLGNYSRYVVGC